jgi:hypothetical protein
MTDDLLPICVDVNLTATRTHIYITMKRQSSHSDHNPSNSKMSKASHSREAPARVPTQKPRYVPPPSLTTKQLKPFQYLVSGASYLIVLQGGTMSGAGVRDKCGKTFHGYDEDHQGVVQNFLDGRGRFEVLWDNGRIVQGYGHLSGLRRDSIDLSIRNATLRGDHILSGRQILEKAKDVLCESKKYLAYWMEFLIKGEMPSGKTEVDALKHVMRRAQEETSCEIEPDNESAGDYFTLNYSLQLFYDCL